MATTPSRINKFVCVSIKCFIRDTIAICIDRFNLKECMDKGNEH